MTDNHLQVNVLHPSIRKTSGQKFLAVMNMILKKGPHLFNPFTLKTLIGEVATDLVVDQWVHEQPFS